MGFTSQLYPGELVIEGTTPETVTNAPAGFSTGLKLGMRTTPYGQMYGTEAFPQGLVIPRSEWQARIQEMEERKSRISDISLQAGLPCKDQNGTNYCWINAPTHCVEILRVMQNQPMVILSPASAGAQIKQGQNVGGWGEEGLRWIVDHGLAPVAQWPANQISNWQSLAQQTKTISLDYRVTEWWELQPRNLDQLISCLLLRIPVAVGYNWWSHEVTACDPVWLNGQAAIRIRNSWSMTWGEQGFSVLTGSRALPDDAVAPRVAVAA